MGGRLSRPHGTFQICCFHLLQARPLCFQVLVPSYQEVQFRYERHHCNHLVVLYIMSKIVFFFWLTFFDFCSLRFQVFVSSHQQVQFRYERHHCNRLVVLYIMSKIVFFFGQHFLIFLRCGSDSWRKSPDISSKFLPLLHESGSSHGWCKTNHHPCFPRAFSRSTKLQFDACIALVGTPSSILQRRRRAPRASTNFMHPQPIWRTKTAPYKGSTQSWSQTLRMGTVALPALT